MTQRTNESKLRTEIFICLINIELDGNVSHLTTKNPLNLTANLIPAAQLPYLISKYHK